MLRSILPMRFMDLIISYGIFLNYLVLPFNSTKYRGHSIRVSRNIHVITMNVIILMYSGSVVTISISNVNGYGSHQFSASDIFAHAHNIILQPTVSGSTMNFDLTSTITSPVGIRRIENGNTCRT